MKDQLQGKSATAMHGLAGEMAQCLGFLTRIPLPTTLPFNLPTLNRAMRQFPVIGAFIGCITGLAVCLGLALDFSSLAAATLAVAITVMITGGLHEDGLADTADGFGGGSSADQKLAIMRDSRIGTYGVLALILAVLLKIQAIAAITALPPWLLIALLAVVGALSRAMMVWLMRTSLPARSDGLAAMAGRPSQAAAVYALALGVAPAMVVLWLAFGLLAGIIVLAVGFAASAGVRNLANRQIGGFTGDVCGAVQVFSETFMLIAASSMID
jgi:adenosylcobinamide-GDP ribazoletransferase